MAGADADHHVVRLVVVALEKMHVVGGDGLDAVFGGEFQESRSDAALRLQVVVVDFHVGVFPAVDFHQFGKSLAGFILVAGEQPLVDRARDAAGEADDALGKLAQRLAVHARLAVVKAFEVALGNEFRQVVPALVGFRQQRHVGGALAADQVLLVRHQLRREVDLAAENRFHAVFLAVLEKFDGPVEVAVVGHRHRRHAEFRRAFGQILGADHAVEQGKLSVDVEVDEGIGHREARR